MWNRKGDVDCDYHKGEAKITGKKQFVLSKQILDKIKEEALTVNKKPVLFVSYENEPTPQWAVIDFNDFLEEYYV